MFLLRIRKKIIFELSSIPSLIWSSSLTSICIFKCCLKFANNVRKIARDSSNTSTTELAPFLDSATHRCCLIAYINLSLVRTTGPAFCSIDNNSCKDRTLDRSSCDLK